MKEEEKGCGAMPSAKRSSDLRNGKASAALRDANAVGPCMHDAPDRSTCMAAFDARAAAVRKLAAGVKPGASAARAQRGNPICAAYLAIGAFELAVQRLNSFRESGEVREAEMSKHEWKISQVEKLIGLSRRDIQRACYSGKGGAAILAPKDSSWGKRSYSLEDLAKLFVVKCHRQKGMSLVESADAFRRFEESQNNYSMLDAQVSLMLTQCDELERQIICGRLLHAATEDEGSFLPLVYECVMKAVISAACSCDADDKQACFALLDRCSSISRVEAEAFEETVCSWLQDDEKPGSRFVQEWLEDAVARVSLIKDGMDPASVARALACVLNHPSIEPAFELWLGPGSFEFIDEAVGALALSNK